MENNFLIPKAAPIQELVRSFWQTNRQNNPSLKETIMPKGVLEIIFSFETPKLYAQVSGQLQTLPKCFVQGFHTHPIQLHLGGKQSFFGVALSPTVVKPVFKFYPAEFSNGIIDLTIIDRSFSDLWHNLGEQPTFDDRVNVFSNWLLKKTFQLTARERMFDDFINTHMGPELSVPQVARHFCYSPKQLARNLYKLTGMNTEQLLLYKKHLHAIHLIHHSELSLTEIAHTCHFSDQSHFTKTFKSFTFITPKDYKKQKSMILGHIWENVR